MTIPIPLIHRQPVEIEFLIVHGLLEFPCYSTPSPAVKGYAVKLARYTNSYIKHIAANMH